MLAYKNYFWDFDGTLYDTYPEMVASFAAALAQKNFKADRDAIYHQMRWHSLGWTVKYYSQKFGLDPADLRKAYDAIEAHKFDSAESFPYADAVCSAVRNQGGRNFLLTHRDKRAIDLLERDGLKADFSGFVTGNDDFPRKPDPASLLYLCRKYAVDPAQSAMVGDRKLDVAAGHNAGMAGILFDADSLIEDTGNPDQRIVSLKELL